MYFMQKYCSKSCGLCNDSLFLGGFNGAAYISTVDLYTGGATTCDALKPLPEGRWSGGAVYFNNRVLYCGGWGTGSIIRNICWSYDGNMWINNSNMTNARSQFTLNRVGDQVFAVGGWKPNGPRLSSVETYDGISWSSYRPGLPETRNAHCAAVLENTGELFVIAGAIGAIGDTDTVLVLQNNIWKEQEDRLPEKIFGHACSSHEDTILVTGGFSSTSGRSNSVYSYTRQGGWKKLGKLPVAVFLHTLSRVKGLWVVAGGNTDSSDTSEKIWSSPNGADWTEAGKLAGGGRNGHVVVSVFGEQCG